VRGKAVAVAVVNNFFWNTVMTFIFPLEIDLIGNAATFFIYAAILAVGIYFIYLRVPETKGLSLEEIEEFFIRGSKMKMSIPLSSEKEPGDDVKLSPQL
jgi:hypothetical protein